MKYNFFKTLTIGAILSVVALLGFAPNASAQDLGDLFVLNQLFNGQNSSGSALPGVKPKNLGDLFVLGQLFGGNSNGIFDNGLGYYNGNSGGYTGYYNPSTGYYNGLGYNNDVNNLGNLFVLNRLFATQPGRSGVFSGNPGNLGDYLILNQIFR